MALSRFIHSCEQAGNYPKNLIDPGPTYPSALREYAQRINARVRVGLPLFCTEVYARVELYWYQEAQNQRSFHNATSTSLQHLQQHLPGRTGSTQEDSACTYVFIGAETSRDPLHISRDMALWILTFFQVLPAFLDFLFAFGGKLYDVDFHFSGFREDTRIEKGLQRSRIHPIDRSGQDFQICYNLKTFERKEGLRWPWSSRQAAIFHSFDVENGNASWIAIKAHDEVKTRLKEVANDRLSKDTDSFHDTSKMFANTLAGHLAVADWSAENWRWYLSDIEEYLVPLRRRAIVDKVARYVTEVPVPTADTTGIPLNNLIPSRTTLRRLTFRSSRTTTTQNAVASQQSTAPLPVAVAVNVADEPQEPPNVPPEYDPKLQGETSDEERKMKYQIQELQDAQALETRVNEAVLILNSNIHVLSEVEKYYEQLPNCPDLPEPLRKAMPAEITRFLKRLRSVRSEFEMHLHRIGTMSTLIRECKELLYGIVEYQAMQANHRFADQAQNSAKRMEGMTKQMQEMAIKTTLETVLMRIITVVTVFFLPATFVSTLMSTDVVKFQTWDSNITSGSTSMGALKLFLCLSLSLMVATFAAGFGLLWGALGTATFGTATSI